MKTIRISFLLFFAIILFLPRTTFSAVNDQLITELLVTDNDTTYRYLYFYDSNGNKVLETKYLRQTESWSRLSQSEWFYQGTKCTLQREKIWKDFSWEISYEISYDYNNGNLTNELHKVYNNNVPNTVRKIDYSYTGSRPAQKQMYSMHNSSWLLDQQVSFKYNGGDKLDSLLTDVYENGIISTQYLLVNSYGNSGNLQNQVTKQKAPAATTWLNRDSISYVYKSGNNSLISQRNKIWNVKNANWENSQMVDYDYDSSNKLLSEDYKTWEVMFWKNNLRYEYSYDQQRLLKKSLLMPIYNQWRSLISIDYSDFDGNKANHVESRFDFWGGVTGEFTTSFIPYLFNDVPTVQKADMLQLNYLPVTDTTSLVEFTIKEQFPVYPNPSYGVYYIDTQSYDVKSWTLLDMEGRELKRFDSEYKTGVIDITEFSSGIYVLKVNCGNKQITQKLIKY